MTQNSFQSNGFTITILDELSAKNPLPNSFVAVTLVTSKILYVPLIINFAVPNNNEPPTQNECQVTSGVLKAAICKYLHTQYEYVDRFDLVFGSLSLPMASYNHRTNKILRNIADYMITPPHFRKQENVTILPNNILKIESGPILGSELFKVTAIIAKITDSPRPMVCFRADKILENVSSVKNGVSVVLRIRYLHREYNASAKLFADEEDNQQILFGLFVNAIKEIVESSDLFIDRKILDYIGTIDDYVEYKPAGKLDKINCC